MFCVFGIDINFCRKELYAGRFLRTRNVAPDRNTVIVVLICWALSTAELLVSYLNIGGNGSTRRCFLCLRTLQQSGSLSECTGSTLEQDGSCSKWTSVLRDWVRHPAKSLKKTILRMKLEFKIVCNTLRVTACTIRVRLIQYFAALRLLYYNSLGHRLYYQNMTDTLQLSDYYSTTVSATDCTTISAWLIICSYRAITVKYSEAQSLLSEYDWYFAIIRMLQYDSQWYRFYYQTVTDTLQLSDYYSTTFSGTNCTIRVWLIHCSYQTVTAQRSVVQHVVSKWYNISVRFLAINIGGTPQLSEWHTTTPLLFGMWRHSLTQVISSILSLLPSRYHRFRTMNLGPQTPVPLSDSPAVDYNTDFQPSQY